MTFSKLKEALALIGILALTVSLWFLKGHSDKKIIDSKNETIKSLQDTVQSKEDIIGKNNALLDSGNTTIKSLQDTIQSKADIIGKDKALVDAKDETIKSLQNDIQAKEDMVGKDKDLLDAKDETIKSLQNTIASYQGQGGELPKRNDNENQDEIVYPDDNGFDAQDLGSGMLSYQYFGKTVINPYNAPEPDRIPNHTPWTFSGNAGIAANGSGFYVSNATNRDSNGTTSKNGQAGFLQFKDSSISQAITLPAGTYAITFDYEGRRDYDVDQIAVSLDGTVLFKGAPTDCNNFKQITTSLISLTTSGKHELTFRGLGGVDDVSGDTTFIDNISVNHIHSRPPGSNRGFPGIMIENAHLNPFPVPSQVDTEDAALK